MFRLVLEKAEKSEIKFPTSAGSSKKQENSWKTSTLQRVRHDWATELNWAEFHMLMCGRIRFSSVPQSCLTLCNPIDRSTTGFPVHHQLPKFTQTPVHWISDAIQPSHPLLPLLLLPSIIPSIRVFSNESPLCIRWLKYWSFNFSNSPSNNLIMLP